MIGLDEFILEFVKAHSGIGTVVLERLVGVIDEHLVVVELAGLRDLEGRVEGRLAELSRTEAARLLAVLAFPLGGRHQAAEIVLGRAGIDVMLEQFLPHVGVVELLQRTANGAEVAPLGILGQPLQPVMAERALGEILAVDMIPERFIDGFAGLGRTGIAL